MVKPQRAFREALGVEVDEAVDAALDDVVARAAASSEGVFTLELGHFVASLARHGAADPLGYLRTVRAEDFALASACAAGDRRALAHFEKLYFREIDRAYTRVRRGAVDRQDFGQRMRERLFVATDARRPRIGDYAGQGDLRTWFRVAVTRTLTTEATRPNRDAPSNEEESFDDTPDSALDPELALLRRKYSQDFKDAFRRALEAMEERDKAVLRKVVVEHQGIDVIAAVYQVHRATAARWVQRAREGLVRGVRKDLQENLRVAPVELESILRLVASEVEVSVRALLPTAG